VVEIEGWRRGQWLDDSGLPWRNPSPNLRSLRAAALYPGIGLLERAVSVGRGTDTPFEVLGTPFVDGAVLAREMEALRLPGVRFSPVRFNPTASVFQGQDCGGVRFEITDREALRPTELGLALAHTLLRLYGDRFELAKLEPLLSHRATMEALRAGEPWQGIAVEWRKEAAAFEERRKPYLIYPR
jgi:uncharacterized protein YbbC (DUF1343 family)